MFLKHGNHAMEEQNSDRTTVEISLSAPLLFGGRIMNHRKSQHRHKVKTELARCHESPIKISLEFQAGC